MFRIWHKNNFVVLSSFGVLDPDACNCSLFAVIEHLFVGIEVLEVSSRGKTQISFVFFVVLDVDYDCPSLLHTKKVSPIKLFYGGFNFLVSRSLFT